jgi:sporadic carbohydrate cluster protein (TIGR04323 family)
MGQNQKGTKAYTTPRTFGGFQIPITMQSTSLRNYCEKNGHNFHLHVVENQIPNTFLVLESLVENAGEYDGIAMCSVSMLPAEPAQRRSVVTRIIEKGCKLHFTFEQLVVSSMDDLQNLDDLISLIELSGSQYSQEHSFTSITSHNGS